MSKIDKTTLSKSEWKSIREHRRNQKAQDRYQKEIEKQIDNIPVLSTTQRIGFVLGNGTSRKPINPEWLRPHGKIYGCNALYREFDPDYLVAVDVKMILELNKAGYQLKNPNVWTNPNRSYAKFTGFNYFNPSKGWSSGPTALWLCSSHKYHTIFILGFDYKGLNEGQKFNNMYADTHNYKKSTDSATFFGNWLRQTAITMQQHPQITYIRVIASDNYDPPELNKIENYSTITIEDFQKQFNFPPK